MGIKIFEFFFFLELKLFGVRLQEKRPYIASQNMKSVVTPWGLAA